LLDQEILQDKNIIITGQVDDVKPFIQNAMVCIAPLISGAGLRGKVIEYAALKRTFVASPIAMEDIDFKNGEDFYLAEEPHEYIKYIIELLNNTEKRNNFSASVYKKVIEKYDTKKLITYLEYFYNQNNS
jgi:glycosyltransferase involved in cell wall biosynthesis